MELLTLAAYLLWANTEKFQLNKKKKKVNYTVYICCCIVMKRFKPHKQFVIRKQKKMKNNVIPIKRFSVCLEIPFLFKYTFGFYASLYHILLFTEEKSFFFCFVFVSPCHVKMCICVESLCQLFLFPVYSI